MPERPLTKGELSGKFSPEHGPCVDPLHPCVLPSPDDGDVPETSRNLGLRLPIFFGPKQQVLACIGWTLNEPSVKCKFCRTLVFHRIAWL